jgi:hypothetical protein
VLSLGVDIKFDLAPGGGCFFNGKAIYTCQGGKMTLRPVGSEDEWCPQLGAFIHIIRTDRHTINL